MSVQYPLVEVVAAGSLKPPLTFGGQVMKFTRTKPLGAAGAAVILLMMLVALLAGTLARYDPYQGDYALQFARPSAEHWLGTDEYFCINESGMTELCSQRYESVLADRLAGR